MAARRALRPTIRRSATTSSPCSTSRPGRHAVNVVVKNGVADLWGVITDDRERKAIVVAVENVAGVEHVHDHLVWVEPMSGMAFSVGRGR